jgi:hypothetical protein
MSWPDQNPLATDVILHLNVPWPAHRQPSWKSSLLDKLGRRLHQANERLCERQCGFRRLLGIFGHALLHFSSPFGVVAKCRKRAGGAGRKRRQMQEKSRRRRSQTSSMQEKSRRRRSQTSPNAGKEPAAPVANVAKCRKRAGGAGRKRRQDADSAIAL